MPGRAARALACAEVAIATAIIVAGVSRNFAFTPEVLLVLGALSVAWRGPGWRDIGLRSLSGRIALVAVAVGIGYQFVGTYLLEPLIARLTTGALPDVSAFRRAVGDEQRLAILLMISWTMGALVEELVFRGWLMTRLAELGSFSKAGWIFSAIGSSALFGVAHLYQGASGVVATGLTGFVEAIVYFTTGRNLWACVLVHGALDSAGFLLIYLGVYPGL